MINKEVAIVLHGVTVEGFLDEVKRKVDAEGLREIRTDLDVEYFKSGSDIEFDNSYKPEDDRCKHEVNISKPCLMETYIEWYDGSVYDEYVSFTVTDRIGNGTGTGIYYLRNVI